KRVIHPYKSRETLRALPTSGYSGELIVASARISWRVTFELFDLPNLNRDEARRDSIWNFARN
ncbi:MAG: hypothetical protein LUQ35_09430, partial [Methanoregula sp.]|nr:hypothetical protein [Methanoregula sp.]